MVKFLVAIEEPRVRFPAGAMRVLCTAFFEGDLWLYIILSPAHHRDRESRLISEVKHNCARHPEVEVTSLIGGVYSQETNRAWPSG